MAIVTISTNKLNHTLNTAALTLEAGDTLNLLPQAGIFNFAYDASPGVLGAGANSLVLNGDVFSATGIGLTFTSGNNDINVGAASTVFGQTMGIAIVGNNSTVGVAGHVIGATQHGISITGTGNTINLLAGSTVQGVNGAISIGGNGGNNITIAGELTNYFNDAITLNGGSNVITVASTGRVISSTYCIDIGSVGTGANQVVNHGVMQSDGSYVVLSFQPGNFVQNTGTMLGGTVISFGDSLAPGTKNTLINSGVIASDSIGPITIASSGNADEIVNTGTILGFGGAIFTGGGDDSITNTGVIQGSASVAISLGDGNDTYNGAGGIVNGKVFGGNGNDTMIGGAGVEVFDAGSGANTMSGGGGNDSLTATGNLNVANGDDGDDQLFFVGDQNQLFGGTGNDWLGVSGNANALSTGSGDDFLGATGMGNTAAGGDGNDTVSVTGNSNALFGEIGDDWVGVSGNTNSLFGGSGNDTVAASGNGNILDGGTGNDHLTAGGHAGDTFIFHPGYQQDDVTGFAAHIAGGSDVIDLQGYGLSFASLMNNFTAQVGTDCMIDFKNGDILTLHNVQKSGLQATDFHF
jgi:Ca2+-binding RTX toxin-like protein